MAGLTQCNWGTVIYNCVTLERSSEIVTDREKQIAKPYINTWNEYEVDFVFSLFLYLQEMFKYLLYTNTHNQTHKLMNV